MKSTSECCHLGMQVLDSLRLTILATKGCDADLNVALTSVLSDPFPANTKQINNIFFLSPCICSGDAQKIFVSLR